jgi:hypothetical protein
MISLETRLCIELIEKMLKSLTVVTEVSRRAEEISLSRQSRKKKRKKETKKKVREERYKHDKRTLDVAQGYALVLSATDYSLL